MITDKRNNRIPLTMDRLMKNIFVIMTVAFCMCACDNKNSTPSPEDLANDSLRNVVAQRENEISDLMGVLNEVQEGFETINAAEGRINVARQQGEGNNREMLRQNMVEIQRTMQMNRELISTLRQQLKDSKLTSTKLKTTLEETIDRLTTQLEEKNAEIVRLQTELARKDATIAQQTEEISNISSNVRELTQQNQQKSQTVARQDQDLHTAYYVFGTKKELKQQSILDSGEVLRNGNFAKDYFTKIDIRITKTVQLYSKSAKLMTNHPAGSYRLEKDAKGLYTLHITDAEKFWSVSKFLVIVVK